MGEQQSLEELFQGKLDDSYAIYHILGKYDTIVEEDDEFIQLILSKLEALDVDWVQPWYQQTESGILKYVAAECPDQPDQYRTDRFTMDEDKQLWKNWKHFIKEYNLPNKPQSFARWRNMEKNKRKTCPFEQIRGIVTSYLARGLQRTLRQVYRHFVQEYAYPAKGPYSPLEEHVMKVCFHHYKEKGVMILSKVLGRESRGIYNQFRICTTGKEEKKERIKWSLDLATKFLNSLIERSDGSFEELRDKQIDRELWQKLEEDMKIPYDKLRRFWLRKLHPQCFLEKPITSYEIRRKVYKILMKSHYKRWLDIRWPQIASRFPAGCTSVFLHVCVSRFIRQFCPDFPRRKLGEVLELWHTNKHAMKNRRLKLVRFNSEGKLAFCKE